MQEAEPAVPAVPEAAEASASASLLLRAALLDPGTNCTMCVLAEGTAAAVVPVAEEEEEKATAAVSALASLLLRAALLDPVGATATKEVLGNSIFSSISDSDSDSKSMQSGTDARGDATEDFPVFKAVLSSLPRLNSLRWLISFGVVPREVPTIDDCICTREEEKNIF